ncbi:MAG: GIY-YIG nuclease family protein [Chloroflexi bacterium]|nr:GIY-YIG nuclease family protein [Chloroflexota bacterium]
MDDLARPAAQAVDDFTKPLTKRIGAAADDVAKGLDDAANSVTRGVRGLIKRERNGWNARNYAAMGKPPAGTRYVYLMEDSANGVHKIGMTTKQTPAQRIQQVAGKSKSKLTYTCIIETPKDAKLEGKLHELFRGAKTAHPTSGYNSIEWFALTTAQVAHACSH